MPSKSKASQPNHADSSQLSESMMKKSNTGTTGISEESDPPPSAFAEPSEPSAAAPGDNPKAQLTSGQEENPQVVVRVTSKQKGTSKL
ncbi:hypothetical protein BJ138DRAFT_1160552 [Hygrophoropsis aurantiaca]|uniref:Uncharacterized protein n=1 Tax=Hygrophoropsis aurantiaca TaxID=72124 RepID=A0ACB8A1U6_9AGAM|nr:hypothetical protein BJ138DRAFT_1160552 [Hygrophoropsis aurantiaca]